MPHKAWLWVAAAQLFTVFWICLTRAATAVEGVLGTDTRGAVSANLYGGYNAYNRRMQVCWAHLKRDFQALVDGGGDCAAIGTRLLAQLRQVFNHWHLAIHTPAALGSLGGGEQGWGGGCEALQLAVSRNLSTGLGVWH